MRLDKARAILPFCGCSKRKDGKIVEVWTPATRKQSPEPNFIGQAKCAHVKINREGDHISMTCETSKVNRTDECEPCPALEKDLVCFHCLAALMLIAEENNVYISFYETREAIQESGRILTIHAGADIFAVVRPIS